MQMGVNLPVPSYSQFQDEPNLHKKFIQLTQGKKARPITSDSS